MTGPVDSLSDERAVVVALKIVAEAAARFDQAYSFSRLSEARLTELVDAVTWISLLITRQRTAP